MKTIGKFRLGLMLIAGLAIGSLIGWIALRVPKSDTSSHRSDTSSRRKEEVRSEGLSLRTLQASLPFQSAHGGFTGSTACSDCHRQQFDSWHGTFHRTMTQIATTETVVAPFNNVRLSVRGRDYLLTQEGDFFFVTMPDPDWEAGALANGVDISKIRPPIVKLPIVMTTGSHHMQGYWVASNIKNMLRQIPWIYLIPDRRWVPREDIFIAPPDSPRHFAVWNDNCIVCHAVAGAPNFDLETMSVATHVAELGISCEACHGPGQKHKSLHASSGKRPEQNDPIVHPATVDAKISNEICGQCHSYFKPPDMLAFTKQGYSYRAGGDLSNTHHMISYQESLTTIDEGLVPFWNDGTCRISGREYTAQIESACHQSGKMTCLSCHSMHDSPANDMLAKGMETNQACIQCHSKYADKIEEHTHHPAESDGSLCYNCHMPHTTFGLLKGIRSHRVQSPRVLSNAKSDHPNACNLCHLDRTMAWSADKLTQWYGQPTPELTQDERDVAGSLLWLLRGDAVQRAVTAWHMNWKPALEASGSDWQLPFIAQLLSDDYSVVRYLASAALDRYSEWKPIAFDFIGTEEHKRASKQKIITSWERSGVFPSADRAGQLLFDAQKGRLMYERLDQLLKQQDKRPIYLPE